LDSEKQSQTNPLLFSPQHCCGVENKVEKTKPILGKGKSKKAKGKMRVNPEFLRRCYLKKQSQFAGGQIGVNSYLKGNYGNMPVFGLQKNKANSKPITGLWPEILSSAARRNACNDPHCNADRSPRPVVTAGSDQYHCQYSSINERQDYSSIRQ
jgi:hypothetical protein